MTTLPAQNSQMWTKHMKKAVERGPLIPSFYFSNLKAVCVCTHSLLTVMLNVCRKQRGPRLISIIKIPFETSGEQIWGLENKRHHPQSPTYPLWIISKASMWINLLPRSLEDSESFCLAANVAALLVPGRKEYEIGMRVICGCLCSAPAGSEIAHSWVEEHLQT